MAIRTLRSAGLAALALLLAACGVIIYETSSRALILEPVERVVFESDGGAIEVYAFNRTAISLLYFLTGYETSIVSVGHEVAGDALNAFILCEGDDLCNADFYCEVPLATALEIRADNGDVTLTGVEGEVSAVVKAGDVKGTGLRSQTFDLKVETGDVTLAWAAAPRSLAIAVETGVVALTLPNGAYRCDVESADGAVEIQDMACDPAAAGSLKIRVQTGDIRLQGTP